MDLLRALAPTQARSPARRRGIPLRDSFGAVTAIAVMSALSAAGGLASTGIGLSQQLKKLWKNEEKLLEGYREEYQKAKAGLARAKTTGAKERHLKRLIRYQELVALTEIKLHLVRAGLIEPGPMLEGATLEMRRNMLADEWETAEPERRKHIERLVAGYDEELAHMQRMVSQFQKIEESRAPAPAPPAAGSAARRAPSFGQASVELILPSDDEAVQRVQTSESVYLSRGDTSGEQEVLLTNQLLKGAVLEPAPPVQVNHALVTGIGGQQFVARAPMREVCVSFYPSRPADSYAGANGILVPGDDPVLLMRLSAGQNTNFLASTDFEISTELFDYGKYRVVGLMSHPQGSYQVRTAAGLIRSTSQVNGVGISIRSIQVYNGEELLLPLGDLDVDNFNIFPRTDAYPGISSTSLSAFAQQAPYNERRSDRFFVGLRTNPVIEGTARLRAIVRCFVYSTSNNPGVVPTGMLLGDTLEVPVSFSLLGQMLEDKVFGDPLVPGPASRPGAQVQLGLREIGTDAQGVQQLQLRNVRYTAPTQGNPERR
jgi:hypothetical protein